MACFALPPPATAQNSANVIISIDEASVGEGDGSVTLTARLSRAVNQGVMLGITYQNGTATVVDDLVGDPPPPRRVTIPPNTRSANFTVFIRNDTLDEPDETLTVSLGGSSLPPETNFVFNGSHRATLTIIDDDDPQPPVNNRVSIVDPQPISEGASHLNFVVNTKFNVRSDVVLGVAYAGGTTNPATPADDLGADRPSTVTISAGERKATLGVPIINDDIVEENETFTVALSLPAENPPGHTLFLDANEGEATGTITDDDTPDARVSIADMTAAEAAGAIGFRVTLSRAVDSAVVLDVTYADGSAAVATDLGAPLLSTVTIAAATTEATLAVPIVDDAQVEGAETFTVRLSEPLDTPLPDGVTIADGYARGTITDNDRAPPPAVVSLASAAVAVVEGEPLAFEVRLSRPVDRPVAVRWTAVRGTAMLTGPDSDLAEGAATAGTVRLGAGATAAAFTLATRADVAVEADETFTVTLAAAGALPAGVRLGRTATRARGTILNDDVRTDLSVGDARVLEGGVLRFAYTLSEAVPSPVSFAYATADGTATVADADYMPQPAGRVTVAAQATAGVLEVPTTADALVEADETLTVRLTGVRRADGGLVTLLDAVVTGTIENDDVGVVSVAPAAVVAAEGETFAFAVRLDTAVDEAVTVRWTVAGTGVNPATLTGDDSDVAVGAATSGTVTFAAGAPGTTPVVLATRVDEEVEGDETFAVTLTAAAVPAGVELAPAPGLGTITDLTSVLLAPRLTGAATALRRHVGHFEQLTSGLVQGRLAGRARQRLNLTPTGTGGLALGGVLTATGVGVWADGAYAGFHSLATGRQVELYGGVDYAGGGGRWLLGALAGREFADLDLADGGRYRAHFTEVGPYGGVRLSERLVFDGAAAYGVATPVIRQGAVSASYAATRLTLRGGLTGDVGLTYGAAGRRVTIMPQLAVSWARERVGGFTDSAGRRAGRATLALGRVSAGPRVTWERGGSQLVGGARMQWDFVQPDGRTNPLSAVVEGQVRLTLTPGLEVGLSGDVDGLGRGEEFLTVGGGVDLRFTLTPANTLGLSGMVDGLGARAGFGPGTGAPNYGMRFEWRIGAGGGAGPVFPGGGHPGAFCPGGGRPGAFGPGGGPGAFGPGGGPPGAFGPGGGSSGAFGPGGGPGAFGQGCRPGALGQTSRRPQVGPVPPAGR